MKNSLQKFKKLKTGLILVKGGVEGKPPTGKGPQPKRCKHGVVGSCFYCYIEGL